MGRHRNTEAKNNTTDARVRGRQSKDRAGEVQGNNVGKRCFGCDSVHRRDQEGWTEGSGGELAACQPTPEVVLVAWARDGGSAEAKK